MPWSFWETVVSNALVATLLALMVSQIGKWCADSRVIHLGWLIVLIKLFTPPMVPVRVAPLQLFTNSMTGSTHLLVASESGFGSQPPFPAPTFAETAELDWSHGLLAIWIIGAVVVTVIYSRRIAAFRQRLRHRHPCPEKILGRARHLAGQLRLKSCPEIALVDARFSPAVTMVTGRLLLILPTGLVRRLNPAALDAILAHELGHVRRRDHWVRVLELAACILFWWHPVVWWAKRVIAQSEEECCDALVMRVLQPSPRLYASALLDTVDFLSQHTAAPVLGTAAATTFHCLARRLKSMQHKPKRSRLIVGGLLVGTLSLLSLGTTLAAKPTDDEPKAFQTARPYTIQAEWIEKQGDTILRQLKSPKLVTRTKSTVSVKGLRRSLSLEAAPVADTVPQQWCISAIVHERLLLLGPTYVLAAPKLIVVDRGVLEISSADGHEMKLVVRISETDE